MNRLPQSLAWNDASSSGHSSLDDENSEAGSLSGESALCWKSTGHSNSGLQKWSSDWGLDRGTPKIDLLPLHYEPNYRYPLIVWLHNDGYNEHQVEHVMPHVSLRNYVSVGVRGVRAADSAGHCFDWSSSPAAVEAAQDAVIGAIDSAQERYSIHPQRVILAGYRSGGTMALRIALSDPVRFAGVVSLGGTMPAEGGTLASLDLLRRRRLPMLWQWARQGERFEASQLEDDIRMAMLIRARVDIRQYEDDDEMNTVTLSDLNEWTMHRIVGGNLTDEPSCWESSEASFSNN